MNTDALICKAKLLNKLDMIESNNGLEQAYVVDMGKTTILIINEKTTVLQNITKSYSFLDYAKKHDINILSIAGGPNLGVLDDAFRDTNLVGVDISNIESHIIRSMESTFASAKIHEIIFGSIDLSNVESFAKCFEYASTDKLDFSGINMPTTGRFSANKMFLNASASSIVLGEHKFDRCSNATEMFEHSYITTLDLKNAGFGLVGSLDCFLNKAEIKHIEGLNTLNTKSVTSMKAMFRECHTEIINLTGMNTSKVVDMSLMFEGCDAEIIGLNTFDMHLVTNIGAMFRKVNTTELNLSNWNTENVTIAAYAFQWAVVHILDISNWNLNMVDELKDTFSNLCSDEFIADNISLKTLKSLDNAFAYCTIDIVDISSWKMPNLESMRGTFANSTIYNLNLEGLKCKRLSDMCNAFKGFNTRVDHINFEGFEAPYLDAISGIFSDTYGNRLDLRWLGETHLSYTSFAFRGCKVKEIDLGNLRISERTLIGSDEMFKNCDAHLIVDGLYTKANIESIME